MYEEKITVVENTAVANPNPGEHSQRTFSKKKTIFRIYQVIWYVLGLIESLLLIRVILKVLGANPLSGFANFIYTLSNPFAMPFQGIFRSAQMQGSYFEWSTLVAGVVYLLVAYALVELFQMIKPTTVQEVESNVNQ